MCKIQNGKIYTQKNKRDIATDYPSLLSAQDETRTHTTLLPLPPQSSVYTNFTTCAYWVPRTGLEPAHLAACAPETHASTNSAIWALQKKAGTRPAWSDERDSNSRPRPWQGRALPTELSSHFHYSLGHRFLLKSGCKSRVFESTDQIFFTFFCKKVKKIHCISHLQLTNPADITEVHTMG